MSAIEMPRIAGETPSDREHLDHNKYLSPHLIVRYAIVGWCLSKFNGLGYIGRTNIQQMHALAETVQKQENEQQSSRLEPLRVAENRIRNDVLQDFIKYVCDPKTGREFDCDRTNFMFQSCTSALLYCVARALPDRFPDPRDLMILNSYDYVEGYLNTYNDYCSNRYDFLVFTQSLGKTIREYFRRFQLGLENGSIRLDPRYRQHFRNSLLAAFDKIRDDLGEEYWKNEFPLRNPEEPLPETRSYDLNDESQVYDWDVDDVPAGGRIVLRQPYAPILEAHQRAKLKVLLHVLDALQRYQSDQGVTREHAIALLACFEDKAHQLLHNMGVPDDDILPLRASAHADLVCICQLACESQRAGNVPESEQGRRDEETDDQSQLRQEKIVQQMMSNMNIQPSSSE